MMETMSKNGDKVTYKDLYELMDKRTTEIYGVVDDLRQQFNDLAEGRLSKIEGRVANMEGRNANEKSAPFANLGYEVVKYIILAVIGAVLLLIFKT